MSHIFFSSVILLKNINKYVHANFRNHVVIKLSDQALIGSIQIGFGFITQPWHLNTIFVKLPPLEGRKTIYFKNSSMSKVQYSSYHYNRTRGQFHGLWLTR